MNRKQTRILRVFRFQETLNSAALGVSRFKKRNMAVSRDVSLAIQLDISFPCRL